MRESLEILAASALATFAAFALVPMPDRDGTAESAGASGADAVSVAATSASVAAMVERWERPPEVSDAAMEIEPPSMPPPPDAPAIAALAPPEPSTLPGIMPQAEPERPPSPQTDTAPPQARNAPERSPRPPERPRPEPEPEPVVEPKPVETPAPKPQQQSVARAEQTASGSNGGATAGNARPLQQATASPAKRQSLMAQWGGQIQNRIARRAPRGAGKGTAVVAISVASSGALQSVGIARSSGNPTIDKLAVQAVRSAGRFPAAPAALGGGTFSFSVPIRSR